MNMTYIQEIIIEALKNNEIFDNVEMIEDVIFAHSVDNTNNSIIVKKAKLFPIEDDEVIKEYIATHSREDYINYMHNLLLEKPGIYCLILIFQKLNELSIIPFSYQLEIITDASEYENDLNDFFSKLFLGKPADN